MEKLICAKAFVNRGYGIHEVFAEQNEYNLTPGIKFKIDVEKSRYKTISASIATDVYRRLEHFLMKECKRKISILNREEMRAVFSILLNCKKNFPA